MGWARTQRRCGPRRHRVDQRVWLATIEGRDFPERAATQPGFSTPEQLGDHHAEIAKRWSAMVLDYSTAGRLGDTVIDALNVAPRKSFQLYGIVAHVLTYSAHRRGLARAMLAHHGIRTGHGDPLEWMTTTRER